MSEEKTYTKKLILDVNHDNDLYSSGPSVFWIDLSESDINRILELQTTVSNIKAYKIEDFTFLGEWRSDSAQRICMAATTVHVSQSRVWWSGYEKHGNIKFTTEQIEIETLNRSEDMESAQACQG